MTNSVNKARDLAPEASRIIQSILEELPNFRVHQRSPSKAIAGGYDLILEAASDNLNLRFGVLVRSRVTPQTALAILNSLPTSPPDVIPVIYAPVISPRVA